MMSTHKFVYLVLSILTLLVAIMWLLSRGAVHAAPQGSYGESTDQIIVKFETMADEVRLLERDQANYLTLLSQAGDANLWYVRPMSGDAHILRLAAPLKTSELAVPIANLAAFAGVAYAEPDLIKQIIGNPHQTPRMLDLIPNDPRYADQWHYAYTPNTSEGLNLPPAWDITTGTPDIVVAVIDTGILSHTDLVGRAVPGYDFINDPFVANDGDGRDPDPSDPGDWYAANECGGFHPPSDSSWHGTHVAGTIGAATNNNLGVAGVNWQAKILPVRVLGKCGGYTSDIVDGMRWAAGLAVAGVPANANPAKVLNVSLGGPGACSATEQNAINAIVAAGSTVVVAAGNGNANAAGFSPASCNNIITVASTNRTGSRAFYSNFGSVVEVSAPGGEVDVFQSDGILSTLDGGATVPLHDNIYAYYQGTSMATPHVAGLASLIKGLLPEYTPAQVSDAIQSTARDFPVGSSCNASLCGAGIADAYQMLLGLDAVILNPAAMVNDGGRGQMATHTVTLYNLTGSTDNFTLSLGAHNWETSLSTENVGPLANGEFMTLTVSVTVPLSVSWYLTDTVNVVATSMTSPGLYTDTATLITRAFAPPEITVIPNALTTAQVVDEVVTRTLTIHNGNGVTGTFSFQPLLSGSSQGGFDPVPWLSVTPVSGTVSSDSSQLVYFVFSAQGLTPGVYHTDVDLYTNDPNRLAITIPVTTTVSATRLYLPVLLKPGS